MQASAILIPDISLIRGSLRLPIGSPWAHDGRNRFPDSVAGVEPNSGVSRTLRVTASVGARDIGEMPLNKDEPNFEEAGNWILAGIESDLISPNPPPKSHHKIQR